jgi:3,4-dihydroxy 2-butanone 4-phosphate synthase/GTP cyclohydrolase II
LINKLRAYSLQDGGLDTVEANERLGFPADLRNYGVGAQILSDLGIHRLRLLTNNPRKIAGLGGYGLQVEERVPLVMDAGDHNADYLAVKRDKLGHLFEADTPCTVLAMAVGGQADTWPQVRRQVESVAHEHGFQMDALHEPRLLALWDRPQFVWKINPGDRDPFRLIKALAKIAGTEALGLMRVPSERMALHPPQTLERLDRDFTDLESEQGAGFIETSPVLFFWRHSEQ